ncbi:hypothetical protein F9K33_16555 [bacterium]|nr:MAG: hypothetical protein F9K33_16555 [bacterium]
MEPTILEFTIRLKSAESLVTVLDRVEEILGCTMHSDSFADEPAFVGDLLGTKIVMFNPREIDGVYLYELQGLVDREIYANTDFNTINISEAILTIFERAEFHGWWKPSIDELISECE